MDLKYSDPVAHREGPGWRALALVLLAYPVAWQALEAVSTAIGFWPVVLRFLLVWWLPVRLWPAVAAVDIGSALLARHLFEGEPLFGPYQVLISVMPVLVYMLYIRLLRGPAVPEAPDRPLTMALLMLAGALAAFTVAPALALYLQQYREIGDVGLRTLMSFGFGDLYGLLVGVPLLLAIRANRLAIWRSRAWLFEGALALTVSLGVVSLARAHPALDEHLLLLAFLPAMVLAFRFGWVGAAWSVGLLGILLAYFLSGHPSPLRVQAMGSVIGGAALLLGAAMSQLRDQRERLEAQHAALRLSMFEQRELAARIVALEDDGQRLVAESLHEQVAPPLQELRTALAMAWRSGGDERDGRLLETLRSHSWQVQDGLERALRRLQPPALDRADLRAVLADGPLWDWSSENEATWSAALDGPVQDLPEHWKVLLYRMAQAGLEAGLARGARRFDLRVSVTPGVGSVDIAWCLESGPDDARPIAAIRDRALAANGDYHCEALADGARHRVRFDGMLVAPR
ncbi:MAG TPA: hypothetical protein DCM32_04960 [Xanthomonadaceae bacterium]|jgi:integral membrane sensor domain MASE1|nr:hypothetical protein [Xanthomonadaceae bacterium]